VITLLQLGAQLAEDFVPAVNGTFCAVEVTGVHVSELEDPTPYLDGGELLLTTGMAFAHSAESALAYMRRLQEKNVHALGLGLGPWLDHAPQHVIDACSETGIELGIVPDQIPFQSVSRAYWRLAARDRTSDLMGSLGAQTALARAAIRPDAISAVVRGLAQALEGWAAFLPADGMPATCYPETIKPLLEELDQESQRFRRGAMPSASTFGLHGHEVVLYPILSGTKIHGFLGVSAGRKLSKVDRQIIMTVCTLLSLRARQRELAASTHLALGSATAKLLLHGQIESARLIGEEAGLGQTPPSVRILAHRFDSCLDPVTALALLATLPKDSTLPQVAGAIHRCQLRYEDAQVHYLILADPLPQSPASVAPAVQNDATASSLRAVLSEPLTLAEIPANLPSLRQSLSTAPAGRLVCSGRDFDTRAASWVTTLAQYSRADIHSAVQSYLRHRGHWEEASRELGIHRNSLRHRIGVANELLGVNLDDPDVAAALWLALRRAQL